MIVFTRGFLAGFAALLFFQSVLTADPPSEVSREALSLQAEVPLSFEECCQKVLKHYPVLKRQNERVELALLSRYQAMTGLYPSVRGVSSVEMSDDPVTVFGMLLRQEKFSQNNLSISSLNSPRHRTNYNFALQGELPVFNAFQTISRIRSSSLFLKAEKLEKEFTAMESLLLATEAYLKVLAVEEIFRLVSEVGKEAGKDLRQAEELKAKGMVLGADFFAAKVTLGRINEMKDAANFQRKSVRAFLNILMGEDPERLFVLRGELPGDLRPPKPFREWLGEAYRARKDLAALEARIKAQGIETFREKTSILPRIKAFSALSLDTHDWSQSGNNYLMGVRGTMDIFDPDYLARWKKARHVESDLKDQGAVLRDKIARDIAEMAPRYEAYVANLPVVEGSMADAREAVEQTALLYREGRKSIADLLEMRGAYIESGVKRCEILSQGEFEHERLLFYSGLLDETRISEIGSRMEKGA